MTRPRSALLAAAASSAALVAWWLVNAGTTAGQPATTLAAMDYVQIHQLVNRLNFGLDYCGNGGRAFADLFNSSMWLASTTSFQSP